MNAKSTFDLHGIHSRKVLLSVSLVFIIILVFSCIFFVSNNTSDTSRVVSKISENELREAVNNATEPVVIVLDGDIKLTESLVIPAGKDITLTSSNKKEFYKLIGANEASTIFIEKAGVLKLDGIIVTHDNGEVGLGVDVWFGGTLIMSGGVICNNCNNNGGGVLNSGSFSMSGGEISNNTGVGVFNNGYDFSMSGGEISNNIGGGVYNYNGKVSLSGGGVICGNTVKGAGGGVYNRWGTFVMSGGVISGNVAEDKGGGVYNYFIFSTFSMSGGEISNNTAPLGGGVCTDYNFTMSGGVIYGNTANTGGGVYVGNGSFSQSGGEISGNTASQVDDDIRRG